MVGTVVLGIFPKEQHCGDVYLYVLGCQRILRLEVNAMESAVIAAALLHGKNTLIKASLDELRSAEVDALLKEASVQIQAGEFVDDDLANDLAGLLEHAQPPKIKTEYALFHTYLETLARLQAQMHCIILSGMGQVNASLVIQDKNRNERFSLHSPLGNALALALYADVPVGIVPALVQRALPVKTVLASVPEEVRSVVEAIMPTPEQEAALQKKMDGYNATPLVTVATGNVKPSALNPFNRRVEISIRRGGNASGNVFGRTSGKASGNTSGTTSGPMDVSPDGVSSDGVFSDGAFAKALFENDSVARRASRQGKSGEKATNVTKAMGEHDEEHLKRLLQRLVPETKVRM